MSALGDWLIEQQRSRDLSLRAMQRCINNPLGTVSLQHLSRLQNDRSGYDSAKVSMDKLWILGSTFGANPLYLLFLSRGWPMPADFSGFLSGTFGVKITDAMPLGDYMVFRRVLMGKKVSDLLRDAETMPYLFGTSLSSCYWSQLELHRTEKESTVSAEALWFIGRVLSTCPLVLFVLSRGLSDYFLSDVNRARHFGS